MRLNTRIAFVACGVAAAALLEGCASEGEPAAAREPAELSVADRGAWSELPPMAESRLYPVTIALEGGRALVTGGFNETFIAETAEIFDPAGGASPWTRTAIFDPARDSAPYLTAFHYAIQLRNKKVLVFGGMASAFLGDQRAYLYDPHRNSWTRTQDLPAVFGGGIGVNAVLLRNGDVFVAGGYGLIFPEGNDAAAIYHVDRGTWEPQEPLPRAVAHNALVALEDGRVLVVGGGGGPGGQDGFNDATVSCPTANDPAAPCPNAQIFDSSTGHWRAALHQMPSFDHEEATADPGKQGGRQWPIALPIKHGLVLVAGGTTVSIVDGNFVAFNTRTSAIVFDPVSETWDDVGPMHTGRTESSTFVKEHDGTPLLLAGFDAACHGNRTSERFDQKLMSFSVLEGLFPTDGQADGCDPGALEPAIDEFGTNAALLSNGDALYVGGSDVTTFMPSARAFLYLPPKKND